MFKNFFTLIFKISGSGSQEVDEAVDVSAESHKNAEIIAGLMEEEENEQYSDSEEDSDVDNSESVKRITSSSPNYKDFSHLSIPSILQITEYIPVQLEYEDQLYPAFIFYGYFEKDRLREIHLIFSSFYFMTEEVNLKSIPYAHVKNVIFETPVLVNSKYLTACQKLKSIINVKINQKTLSSVFKSRNTLTHLDFRIYNLKDSTLKSLNAFSTLRYLKINFRKKIFNRKDIKMRLDGLSEVEILEYWNTSSFQFISLPDCLFYSIGQHYKNLKSLVFVRVRLKVEHFIPILQNCRNLEEFEFLGNLTKKHFEALLQIHPKSLREINLSGSILEDEYVNIFKMPELEYINISHSKLDSSVLEHLSIPKSSRLVEVNMSGIKDIPTSVISKLCELGSLKMLHFEKCRLREEHFMIFKNSSIFKTLKLVVDDPSWMDEEVVMQIDQIKETQSKLVIQKGSD